jgi:hypothetical protein
LGIAVKGVKDPMALLEKTFKGSAEAAANNDPFQQLQVIMGDLQETIGTYLLPAFKKLAAYLKSQNFKDIVDSAKLGFDQIGAAADNVGTTFDVLIKKLSGRKNFFKDYFADMFGGGNWVKNIPVIGSWIGILSSPSVTNAVKGLSGQTGSKTTSTTTGGKTIVDGVVPPPKVIKEKVKTVFDTLAEEMKKQTAALKLQSLGASQGLIDAVIGSGSTWETSFKKIVASGKKGVASLQKEFNKTASGMSEVKAAADAAAQAAKDAYDAALQTAQDNFQKASDAARAANDAIDGFRKSMSETLTLTAPLDFAEANYGRFEAAVVSTFDTIKGSLKDALANKTITKDAADALGKYADDEAKILRGIARQRDVIASKISIAQTIMGNVMQFGNITSLLGAQASTITKTYQKTIQGVLVTFTEAVAATEPTDIVANYRNVIQQTKDFAANLKVLKAAGLNQNLFKQIVDAGVSAGGATAAAIVAGGSSTISELNGLFGELADTGNTIASESTNILYSAGLETISGFILGLQEQDAALQEQARVEAKNFTDAFQAQLDTYVPKIALPKASDYGLSEDTSKLINKPGITTTVAASLGDAVGQAVASGQTSWLSGILGSSPTALTADQMAQVKASNASLIPRGDNSSWNANMGSTINLTVNAGLGTNGSSVGAQVVQVLKQYERTNGAVWVSA